MLVKSNKVHITCDVPDLFGTCKYEWIGTEEEYAKIMAYDGESLNHFPNRQTHREYIFLKEGKCPFCEKHKEIMSRPPAPMVRGGVIPTPRFDNRIPRRNA